MQLVFLLLVLTSVTISVLPNEIPEQEKDGTKRELSTGRGNSLARDETTCVCKVGHLQFGYRLKQSNDGNGKKCECQKAKKIIRKKWRAAIASRKRPRPHHVEQNKRYCLKPGRGIWRGERRYYCIETWFRVKNCVACNPVDFIPTPL